MQFTAVQSSKGISVPKNQLTSAILGPRYARLIAMALVILIGIFLVASTHQESQTVDEADHLFSGYEYWKHADFGRNPEHPPLAKLLAAVPLLSMGLKEPPPASSPFFKAQDFLDGSNFFYTADADAILARGRMVVALFTLALAVQVFLATREMFNELAALIALSIFAFEPALLANGALVTTDMPLTCLFFASVYSF
jgi:dolichyl-phosphate-mannose--protein O-mannosyl transferase